MTHTDISALVSSRICHDLISPIGAISNGIELMAHMIDAAGPEMGLIGDSVNSATQKLRCFRIAFGAANDGQTVAVSELASIMGSLFQGRSSVRIASGHTAVPRRTAKLLLLTLLCQERCLPLGGKTAVTLDPTGFLIHTTTTKTRDPVDLWAMVETPAYAPELLAANVQFLLLGQLIEAQKLVLDRQIDPTEIRLGISNIHA